MLITVYIIVATLNVLAKHNNYGINVKRNPDFDIRVRRNVDKVQNDVNENILYSVFEYINEEMTQESKKSRINKLLLGIGLKGCKRNKGKCEKEYLEENMDQINKDNNTRRKRQVSGRNDYIGNTKYNNHGNNGSFLYNPYNITLYKNVKPLYNPYNNSDYNIIFNGNGYMLYSPYNQTDYYSAHSYINKIKTPTNQYNNTNYDYTTSIFYKGHNGTDYIGYNNTIKVHNEVDYLNSTHNDDITSTTPIALKQTCIFCSYGMRTCPVNQQRIGPYCVPLLRP